MQRLYIYTFSKTAVKSDKGTKLDLDIKLPTKLYIPQFTRELHGI